MPEWSKIAKPRDLVPYAGGFFWSKIRPVDLQMISLGKEIRNEEDNPEAGLNKLEMKEKVRHPPGSGKSYRCRFFHGLWFDFAHQPHPRLRHGGHSIEKFDPLSGVGISIVECLESRPRSGRTFQ